MFNLSTIKTEFCPLFFILFLFSHLFFFLDESKWLGDGDWTSVGVFGEGYEHWRNENSTRNQTESTRQISVSLLSEDCFF